MYTPLSAPAPNCPVIHEIALGQNTAFDNTQHAVGEGFAQLDQELAASGRAAGYLSQIPNPDDAPERARDSALIYKIAAATYANQRYVTLGRMVYWSGAGETLEVKAGRHARAHACYGTCDPAPETLLREVRQKNSYEQAQARGDALGRLSFGIRSPRATEE